MTENAVKEDRERPEDEIPELVVCQDCGGTCQRNGEKCDTCWGTGCVSDGEPGSERYNEGGESGMTDAEKTPEQRCWHIEIEAGEKPEETVTEEE